MEIPGSRATISQSCQIQCGFAANAQTSRGQRHTRPGRAAGEPSTDPPPPDTPREIHRIPRPPQAHPSTTTTSSRRATRRPSKPPPGGPPPPSIAHRARPATPLEPPTSPPAHSPSAPANTHPLQPRSSTTTNADGDTNLPFKIHNGREPRAPDAPPADGAAHLTQAGGLHVDQLRARTHTRPAREKRSSISNQTGAVVAGTRLTSSSRDTSGPQCFNPLLHARPAATTFTRPNRFVSFVFSFQSLLHLSSRRQVACQNNLLTLQTKVVGVKNLPHTVLDGPADTSGTTPIGRYITRRPRRSKRGKSSNNQAARATPRLKTQANPNRTLKVSHKRTICVPPNHGLAPTPVAGGPGAHLAHASLRRLADGATWGRLSSDSS